MTHDSTWMNLEGIVLSETSQTQRKKYCMISLTYTYDSTRVIKFIETGSRMMATRNQGEGKIGNYLLGTAFHPVEILQVLEVGSDDYCITM